MASVIRDQIPGTLALSIILDRARTYLIRARGHKQLAQLHRRKYASTHYGYHKGRMDNHEFFARHHRCLARSLLVEAEAMKKDTLACGDLKGQHGARLLDGASFIFWPQYKREISQFKGDLWLGEKDARRKSV